MAELNIANEIEKKSREIVISNQEIASRLKRNQEAIDKFNDELETLRKGLSQTFEQSMKAELEKVRSDLSTRKDHINEMIDELGPIGDEIAKREGLISYLKQQLAEKDGMLKVLKDKLAEKMAQSKDYDTKVQELASALEAKKKSEFAAVNKASAIEHRLFSVDEQNQRLSAELSKAREKVSFLENELRIKQDELISIKASSEDAILRIKNDETEGRSALIRENSKRLTSLNATIAVLKAKLEQQEALLAEKDRKSREILQELNNRLGEVLSVKQDFPTEYPKDPYGAPRTDEIIPMIELALSQGDKLSDIRHSLLNSGYSKEDIEEGFARLNLGK